ncbi:MAG: hypothetical protein ACRD3T_21020, partial [Terriglobia bacterium]
GRREREAIRRAASFRPVPRPPQPQNPAPRNVAARFSAACRVTRARHVESREPGRDGTLPGSIIRATTIAGESANGRGSRPNNTHGG